jgi:hypothetical protein
MRPVALPPSTGGPCAPSLLGIGRLWSRGLPGASVACLRVAPFLFSCLFRGPVPLARVYKWCLCGWPWGPGLFLVLLCVAVAFLCFDWFMLQRDFFRLCCDLCRPVLLGRLPACAFWLPAWFPPFPYSRLFVAHGAPKSNWGCFHTEVHSLPI